MVTLVKSNQRQETQLVNVWMWENHRTALQWRRVRVGTMPNHELGRMFQVTLRWVDAIFVEDNRVFIVEAKLRPDAGAIGQLLLYKQEFLRTPEFSSYWDLPVHMVFLCKKFDTAIAELTAKNDIIYEVFTDEDISESLLAPKENSMELSEDMQDTNRQ